MISKRSKNAGIKELSIFDNFEVDNNLPKHNTKINSGHGMSFSVGSEPMMVDGNNWDNKPSSKNSFFGFIKKIGAKRRARKEKKFAAKFKKTNLITIREYFLRFAETFNDLTPMGEVADHYSAAIKQAKKLGQKALVEKLTDLVDVVLGESILIQSEVTKFVTNDQMCDFYESVGEDKALKLTWIANFTKIIPVDIVELKEYLDEKKVFDNYVILHYDPNGDASTLTKEEIEVKKDPILFGVIKNSKKLYYIGDWVDDYCDLTLDKMFAELKEEVLTINNGNLKTYIDRAGELKSKRIKL